LNFLVIAQVYQLLEVLRLSDKLLVDLNMDIDPQTGTGALIDLLDLSVFVRLMTTLKTMNPARLTHPIQLPRNLV
jgi:hypothetical protein